MADKKTLEKTVDIEKVFRSKSPGTAKMIPGFVFSYLKRVIHENEINDHLNKNEKKIGLDFVEATLDMFGVIVTSSGVGNIPKQGRALLAANHPLGGLDGLALMQEVGKTRKDIIFPVNDLLMFLPQMRPLFIPINKHGSNSENIKIMQQTFESEKLILYFPAGLVSRKQKTGIRDLEWKKTFITKAKQYKRDIVPVFIDGKNSTKFYNLANFRKRISLKANIEMLYLPDEMFKQKGKKVHIIYGKPIPYETFDKRFNNMVWAEKVKDHVYSMGEGNTDAFDPKK
ncbi:MAG: glycerol acyltransferase [Bacteroidetes bacterium]|nr:MAG: glycerol acyltransferase [Bacteroidota bacterium]